ncbi:hypothetical protein MP866_24240, partial [Escherichia coli]|nr:hypothetical protein [Escherichia coli]
AVNDFMDSVHHIWCPLFSQEFQDLPDGAETTLTDERAHARHLGQGAQTLVRPPGGGPVQAGPLAAPATGRLHERQ